MTVSFERYNPKIGLILKVDLPVEWISEFEQEVALPRSDLEIRQIYSGPSAGILLYLPQAIGLFLASQYFGSLVSELGKDHYKHIKSAAKNLWARSRSLNLKFVGTESKLRDADQFQLAFSITGETAEGRQFKLVLRSNVTEADAQLGIDRFLDLVRDLNLGELPHDQAAQLLSHRAVGGLVVLTFDAASGEIVPVVDL